MNYVGNIFVSTTVQMVIEFRVQPPSGRRSRHTGRNRLIYVLHQIRDWGARIAQRSIGINSFFYVNRAKGCNAYYNGDVNFFAKEGRCNNTAEIFVNYHEWGHGFHYYSVNGGGGIVDGSVGKVCPMSSLS